MNFYETKMGHTFFEHQVPQLIAAVNALTAALSRPVPSADLPVAADPEFLRSLFFGSYEPEVYKVSPKMQQFGQAVSLAHDALTKTLTEEGRQKLEEYEAALSERNAAVTEQAYESGIRAAVQIMIAGLTRPASREGVD